MKRIVKVKPNEIMTTNVSANYTDLRFYRIPFKSAVKMSLKKGGVIKVVMIAQRYPVGIWTEEDN